MFIFQAVIKRLEQERDMARGNIEHLEEERDALRDRLKVLRDYLFVSYKCTWAVQKVSDLWSAKIQLFILTSETLIPFKVVSLVMHTLLPAVLLLLETFLESCLWNHVQLGCRIPHNVFS